MQNDLLPFLIRLSKFSLPYIICAAGDPPHQWQLLQDRPGHQPGHLRQDGLDPRVLYSKASL
jgi:hypothetical protein